MGFRNPLTSMALLEFPTSGLTGVIQGSQLAADAIDGKTITGALIRTAATGQRIEIDSVADGQFRFYTGIFEESEGRLRTFADAGRNCAELTPPKPAGSIAPTLTLRSRIGSLLSNRASVIALDADTITLTVPAGERVIVNANTTIAGSIAATTVISSTDQRGTVTFPPATIAAGGSSFIPVTAAPAFPTAPTVMVALANAPAGSVYLVPRVVTILPGSFRIYLYNVGPSAATYASDVVVAWRAST